MGTENSAELGQWTLSPEAYVKLLYQTVLGREPDEEGFRHHVAAMRNGRDPTQLLSDFVQSPERKTLVMKGMLAQHGGAAGIAPGDLAAEVDLDFVLAASREHFCDAAFFEKFSVEQPFTNHRRPIRTIAIYYWRLNNGGTERVTARLIRMWRDMGYRVLLITDEPANLADDYDHGVGVVRHVIPPRIMEQRDYVPRGRALASILQNEGVDLFVTNQWFEISTYWDIFVARSLGVPVVLGWHNAFDAGIHSADDLNRAYVRFLGSRHADLVAVLSEVDRAWFGTWNVRAQLVHNPMTFDRLPEIASPLEGTTIVWIARAERHQKRIDLVLRMMPLVLARVPDARLVVVGGGGDLAWAQEYAEALGIASRVYFVGYSKEVDTYIDRAAVHVMTSEFEGYPMVLGEVWSHGVPSVLFDLPQLEYLRKGRGHVVVPQGDVAALADAVAGLLEDPTRRRKLGAEARAVVDEIVGEDLTAVWGKIFDRLAAGTASPVDTVACDDPLTLQTLVHMLSRRLMDLRPAPAPAEYPIWMKSQVRIEPPRRKWTRQLVAKVGGVLRPAARWYRAGHAALRRDRRLRTIDLSHVGLGDNIMLWTGLFALLDNGADVCAPGCTLHVPGILTDLAEKLFARFGITIVRGRPEQEVSPVFSPLPPANYNQWWSTFAGKDWRMNWVEALDLQKTLPRHGADSSFRGRVRLHLSELLIYRRFNWARATPGYIGYRVWLPLAYHHGVYPLVFMANMKRSLAHMRKIVADYVDAITSPGQIDSYRGNAAFPTGKSFQTISPRAYAQIEAELGEDFFTCYVQNDSAWKAAYENQPIATRHIADFNDTLRIIKYSDNLLTTDSFTSHVAQLLRDDFVLVLSRDMKESILHPGCNPQVFANHPPCAPCNYQERSDFDRCVAGYETCAAFENHAFVSSIATAFRR